MHKLLKSRLGYVILMAYDSTNCNIVHYGRNKCNRISSSIMATKVQSLVLSLYLALITRDHVEEMTGKKIRLEAVIGSTTVFNVIVKDDQFEERRLQIYVPALSQIYDLVGELDRLLWIHDHKNPADPLKNQLPPPNILFKSSWSPINDRLNPRVGKIIRKE